MFGLGDPREPRARSILGQALVEFMLILPLVLLVMFAIIEIARVMHAWLAVVNGARFGVRYAVTNTFDPSNCPVGGCITDADERDARLDSIRDAAIVGSTSILRDLGETDWEIPGFFEVTVCSDSANDYTESHPSNFSTDWTADCDPDNDAGEEGDLVWVTVDFNHPLIAPILSSDWPMLHLTARRDGVVESFRTVRFVGAGPFTPAPTATPSNTPTPSDTPTPTETFTPSPTPCKVPPVVEIVSPTDGAVFNSGDHVDGQATAYDPDNVNPDTCIGVGFDGQGIERVEFRYYWWDGSGWDWMHSQGEGQVAYCGLGGNSPCTTFEVGLDTTWPSGNVIMSGLHRLEARARDDEDVWSDWTAVEFTINAPPTPTPTFTPVPSCDEVSFGGFTFDDYAMVRQQVLNNSYPGLEVVGVTVYWDPLEQASDLYGYNSYVDFIEWDGDDIYSGNDYSSSTSDNTNMPQDADIGSYDIRVDWDGSFNDYLNSSPVNLSANNFGFSVEFNDSDCNLYRAAEAVNWPTPTPSLTPSITPSPTPTDPPDCDDIYINNMWLDGDDEIRVRVRNNNDMPAYLVNTRLTWPDVPSGYVDEFVFNGQYYGGNDYSSPTGWISSNQAMGSHTNTTWRADFDGEPDGGIWGDFTVQLVFDFPGGPSCSMSRSMWVSPPPTPSNTPPPSNTPVPSNTPEPSNTPHPSNTPNVTDTPVPTTTPVPTIADG